MSNKASNYLIFKCAGSETRTRTTLQPLVFETSTGRRTVPGLTGFWRAVLVFICYLPGFTGFWPVVCCSPVVAGRLVSGFMDNNHFAPISRFI